MRTHRAEGGKDGDGTGEARRLAVTVLATALGLLAVTIVQIAAYRTPMDFSRPAWAIDARHVNSGLVLQIHPRSCDSGSGSVTVVSTTIPQDALPQHVGVWVAESAPLPDVTELAG